MQNEVRPEGTDALGGLSALTGAGTSQLRASAAMRARDVSRPRAEHVAAAERHRGGLQQQPTAPQPPAQQGLPKGS